MKKLIIRITLVAAFAFAAGYNVYTSQRNVEMSDLAMENVETLASGEVIVGPWYCAGNGFCFDIETQMLFEGDKSNF